MILNVGGEREANLRLNYAADIETGFALDRWVSPEFCLESWLHALKTAWRASGIAFEPAPDPCAGGLSWRNRTVIAFTNLVVD
jgi:hypothetical protein